MDNVNDNNNIDSKQNVCRIYCVDFTREDRHNAVQEVYDTDEHGQLTTEQIACIEEVISEFKEMTEDISA